MQKNKWTFKDKLEITESIFTIIVSLIAIWGTVVAWKNGFWHKLEHITNYVHHEIMEDKKDNSIDVQAKEIIKQIKKKI